MFKPLKRPFSIVGAFKKGHSLGTMKLQECSLTPLFVSAPVGSVLPTEVWTADGAAAEMFLLVFLELNGLNCLEPSCHLSLR